MGNPFIVLDTLASRRASREPKREWHGCSDARGHSFENGVCQTKGCGMDLRFSSEKEKVCRRCQQSGGKAGWTCRKCGEKRCEHLCSLKKPDGTATCGKCKR